MQQRRDDGELTEAANPWARQFENDLTVLAATEEGSALAQGSWPLGVLWPGPAQETFLAIDIKQLRAREIHEHLQEIHGNYEGNLREF